MQLTHLKYEGVIYSPFTGKAADGEDGPNASDGSLKLVYYGSVNQVAYVSDDLKERFSNADNLEDVIDLCGDEKLVGFKVDTGWDGVNLYVFSDK
jgi:hypothetical protein